MIVSRCPSHRFNASVLPWETVKPENQALADFLCCQARMLNARL